MTSGPATSSGIQGQQRNQTAREGAGRPAPLMQGCGWTWGRLWRRIQGPAHERQLVTPITGPLQLRTFLCKRCGVRPSHTPSWGPGDTALIFRVGLRGLGCSQGGSQERPFSSSQAGAGLHQRPGSWPVGRQSPAAGRKWRPVTGRQRPRSRAPVAPWRPQVAVMTAPTPSREDTEAQRDSGQGAPACGPGAARGGVSKQRQSFVKPPMVQLTQHLTLTPGSIIPAWARERVTCPRDTAGKRLSSCQTREGDKPSPMLITPGVRSL